MQIKKRHIILGAIFVLILAVQLFFALQTPQFVGDESYFNLRQIEHIRASGFPAFNDELSYGGRFFVFLPFFHYIIAFFSLFMPVALAAKIIPAIFASLSVFIVYLIAKEITQSDETALFSGIIGAFIPIYLHETVNAVSVLSLQVPLFLFQFYCFLKMEKNKQYIALFIIAAVISALTSSLVFITIASLLLYLLIMYVENIGEHRAKSELVLFSALLVTWITFIIYKNAFLLHGTSIVWQNIPKTILASYFSEFSILEAIYLIGIIPFIFGIYAIFNYLFKERKRAIYLFASTAIAVMLLLWLKIISLHLGLVFLAFALAILSSQSYKDFTSYLAKTKLASYQPYFVAGILLIFTATSVFPSVGFGAANANNAVTLREVSALSWISQNTKANATILSTVQEGHLVTEIGKRRDFMDNNFVFAEDASERYNDLNKMYTMYSETDAIGLLNKYDISYIMLSPIAIEAYGADSLSYTSDKTCFDIVYDDGSTIIYQVLCTLEVYE